MNNTPSNAEAWDLWLESITGGHHPASLAKFARAVLAKWGTPQPTQAQAVAVPLTDEQVESLLYKYGYDPDDEHMAAMLKEAHGIKGGQHGDAKP